VPVQMAPTVAPAPRPATLRLALATSSWLEIVEFRSKGHCHDSLRGCQMCIALEGSAGVNSEAP